MQLFGPRLPCPHCGKHVHKPHDEDDFLCPHCHQPGPWASPDQVDAWAHAEADRVHQAEARAAARAHYDELLAQVSAGSAPDAIAGDLRSTAVAAALTPDDQRAKGIASVRAFAALALGDDIVSAEEDRRLAAYVAALGLSWDDIRRADPDLPIRLLVAEANAGLLPQLSTSQLIPKKGEVVHLEWPAALMKQVTLRQYRGGYQGFSFPIGKTGIRYRVGGARGHSVVVGAQMQVDDAGTLSISSKRAVFIGGKKTVEMPYAKLISLNVFADGIQFHQSNRQTAPLFRVENGEAVAAVVNAAAHRAALDE